MIDPLLLREAIKLFLIEDLGTGDITSTAIFSPEQQGRAIFIAKESLVTVGMDSVAAQVFKFINPQIISQATPDGQTITTGQTVLEVSGPILDLLKAERVALNLVQRLCGIATLTAKFIAQVKGLSVKIVDTRKTTPGLRLLEKYAVRVGGGHNHRSSLSEGILIKDNHIAAAGSIQQAVNQVRGIAPHTIKIEIEAETIEQVQECLNCDVDIILLDNMDYSTLRQAVDIAKGKVLLEASGGINLNNVSMIAETGVDIISIGALTHSASACDISMQMA